MNGKKNSKQRAQLVVEEREGKKERPAEQPKTTFEGDRIQTKAIWRSFNSLY